MLKDMKMNKIKKQWILKLNFLPLDTFWFYNQASVKQKTMYHTNTCIKYFYFPYSFDEIDFPINYSYLTK